MLAYYKFVIVIRLHERFIGHYCSYGVSDLGLFTGGTDLSHADSSGWIHSCRRKNVFTHVDWHHLTGTVAMVTGAAHQSVASWLKCLQASFPLLSYMVQRCSQRTKTGFFSPFCVLDIDHFPSDHQPARGKERTLQGKNFKPGMIFVYLHSQL